LGEEIHIIAHRIGEIRMLKMHSAGREVESERLEERFS